MNFTYNMKYVALLPMGLLLSACTKFLEPDPPQSMIDKRTVFENDATATAAILGIYSEFGNGISFASGHRGSIITLSGLSADELIHASRSDVNMLEFQENSLHSTNSDISNLWSTMYTTIYQANAILESLTGNTSLTDSIRRQLTGEALFVRAFSYFYLTNLFGDVPLAVTTDYNVNMLLPRTSREKVYEQIIADLTEAQGLLLESYIARSGERIRPNKFAAMAMVARVYLYMGKWTEAAAMATQVIEHTSLYELRTDLDEVFLRNNKEAIWQIMPVGDGTGLPNEVSVFDPGSVLLYYNILNSSLFQAHEPNDNRITSWVDTLFVDSDTALYPVKYKQYVFDAAKAEYSMVIRLAELYLIRAEARAMQNILTGANSAAEDLNKIRHRAGLLNTTATTREDMLNAIMQEKKIELFTEWGHRWLDLKRWKKAIQVMAPLKGSNWQATDTLYPLPFSEISSNPNLKPQNSGY